MSGLAALLAGHTPTDVYQWHNAASVEDVQHAVEKAGWTFRHLDAWTIEDKDSFVKSLGASLGLEGADDLDAVGEAVSSATFSEDGQHGTVFLWDGWSPLARHDEAAFDQALALLLSNAQGRGLAVILRGEGPELELEELPVKH